MAISLLAFALPVRAQSSAPVLPVTAPMPAPLPAPIAPAVPVLPVTAPVPVSPAPAPAPAAPTPVPATVPATVPAPAVPKPALPDKVLNQPGNVIAPVAPASGPTTANETLVRLVLNRTKRRVYVYENDKVVSSYPVAVGKPGWETPLGEFQVLSMELNPVFRSFKTGRVVPPGPDNPLGVRWIGIQTDGKTQLGFHGTNEPELIGQAVSHGCIRMHNKDVTKLYKQVRMGTMVTVIP
jgi:L,D-transpeptidase ErfK/SrfK